MRGLLKYITPILALIVLVPLAEIYHQNIDKLSESLGLDKILMTGGGSMQTAAYGPLLVLIFVFLLGASGALWLEYWLRDQFPRKLEAASKKTVQGKRFRHERVIVDGTTFEDCHFDGVTIVYNGTGYYSFVRCGWAGNFSLDITDPSGQAVLGFIELSQQLKLPLLKSP